MIQPSPRSATTKVVDSSAKAVTIRWFSAALPERIVENEPSIFSSLIGVSVNRVDNHLLCFYAMYWSVSLLASTPHTTS